MGRQLFRLILPRVQKLHLNLNFIKILIVLGINILRRTVGVSFSAFPRWEIKDLIGLELNTINTSRFCVLPSSKPSKTKVDKFYDSKRRVSFFCKKKEQKKKTKNGERVQDLHNY